MKKTLALVAVVLAVGMTTVFDAEAKRLGGGKSGGMQRQNVTAPAQTPPGAPGSPAQAAPTAGAPAAAAAGAAATAKRSWMGPVAGLAAGLGIAALASHFGFGEALANMLTVALVVMVVLAVVGFLMRRRMAAQQPAAAGGPAWRSAQPVPQPMAQPASRPQGGSLIGSGIGAAVASGSTGTIPAGFDAAAFERNAKAQFMELQSANDAGDLQRLRGYLTPEMFEEVRAEVAERAGATQQTEVFGLQAQVLNVAEEGPQYVVSVRFTGSVREQPGATPEDLAEVWHLVKPRFGDGGWVIAGIQQA